MKQDKDQKAKDIADRNRDVDRKSSEIEAVRRSLEEKILQLALASKYKSEFLANMSHELRTPLNSLLVLSELLAENDEGNLTSKQIEFAKTIHTCGSELLSLIDDILDLEKIESGKMVLDIKQISLKDLKKDMELNFSEVARLKGLEFRIELTQRAGQSILTDEKRLKQILKNLLSNALKFTERGSVTLLIDQNSEVVDLNTALEAAASFISFVVSDTGIGIAREKQKLIFDPFQQADGTTSRRYGGTGLGLAISREMAHLLGGKLEVASEMGKGSTFSFHLPASYAAYPDEARDPVMGTEDLGQEHVLNLERNDTDPLAVEPEIGDDRLSIRAGDLVFLIIEQDLNFASMLQTLARKRGFKTLITGRGEVGVTLAEKFLPQAITLDLKLADGKGWTTLECLRRSQKTRQIPLQLVSIDGQHSQGMNLRGAGTKSPDQLLDETSTFLDRIQKNLSDEMTDGVKPESARQSDPVLANRTVLILDDDPRNVFAIRSLLTRYSMHILDADNGRDGLDLLYQNPGVDCILMDVMMPKLDGYETMRELRRNPKFSKLPIIALTAKAMKGDREKCLEAGASDYIAKPVDTKAFLVLLRSWLAK